MTAAPGAPPTDATVRIVALGGLGEFGMNMMALTYGATTIVIDAGVMFPGPDLLGVDLGHPGPFLFADGGPSATGARADARA